MKLQKNFNFFFLTSCSCTRGYKLGIRVGVRIWIGNWLGVGRLGRQESRGSLEKTRQRSPGDFKEIVKALLTKIKISTLLNLGDVEVRIRDKRQYGYGTIFFLQLPNKSYFFLSSGLHFSKS